ncbi:MAG: hypothetical protein ACI4ER_07685 [Suilimivivens sp.]
MQKENNSTENYLQKVTEIVFPLVLLLFPLLKIGQGVDLTDTPYSLGNYRFFAGTEGVWVMATFLSNVAGFLLTKLPFGTTMIGMKCYTSLLVSIMALFGYRFFKTKMPAWVAFLGEMAAIGFCWCPTAILYNYMTYFFFLLGAVFLFRGLAGSRPVWLFIAGVCLGLNVSVRVPNVLETLLIVTLWYYGARKKKSFENIAKETGLCVAGFLAAQAVMFLVMSLLYGFGAYGEMISGLFGMSGSASDYTLSEMLLSILSAYGKGFKWMLYMLLCILPGIPFFMIKKEKFPFLRRVVYCLCIGFLFFVLYKWGMYNFRYYQKESGLQWGVIFLILSIAINIWMLGTKMIDDEWMLIGSISLVMILITPLGSNNYVWPALNNLFFTAPVTFWMVYKFARWGREYVDSTGKVPFFPAKAMMSAMVLAFFVQSIGLGCFYVFLDGEDGQKRTSRISENPVLEGMHTTDLNGETLSELSSFLIENESVYEGKELILYGNIPGLSYYLDRASAIFTSWPDLDTNSLDRLDQDLKELTVNIREKGESKPLVILSSSCEEDHLSDGKDEKLSLIAAFMKENEYSQAFANEAYVVYE